MTNPLAPRDRPRVRTGLECLLADPAALAGRRYALLTHGAAITATGEPAHLALAVTATPPRLLLGPEHGLYGVEQDMVAAAGGKDPATGLAVASLYGDGETTLRPNGDLFAGLDLLVIDLQDVGSRYYTYAATGVWAGAVAAARGCEVWVLDRPNPIGGEVVEGNLPQPGFTSFVGAFDHPVRHGLTLGELTLLEARREGWDGALRVWTLEGWRRSMGWEETGLPWIPPSPNMPTPATALLYPGGCLVEATALSEGRGTTRPFHLLGAPHLDGKSLAERLRQRHLPGVLFVPTRFRPQFQKHGGAVCGGVEIVVTDRRAFAPYRTGVELLAAAHAEDPAAFAWRQAPYEFVHDRPAIDLLTRDPACREALEGGDGPRLERWMEHWREDQEIFRESRRPALLYPESTEEAQS